MRRISWSALKGGQHLDHAAALLRAGGLVGDRGFCVVDPVARKVLRTVQHPGLLGVRATADGEGLELRLPDGRGVSAAVVAEAAPVAFDYWGRRPRLVLLRGPHADLLSEHLGRAVRLARAQPSAVVYGAPVSLITTGELRELSDRLGTAVDPRVFRANLVVHLQDTQARPVPGERWRIGEAEVVVRGPIPRCAVIDRDPDTGAPGQPLLSELAQYRRTPAAVVFGYDATVVRPGAVQVGDPVRTGQGERPE